MGLRGAGEGDEELRFNHLYYSSLGKHLMTWWWWMSGWHVVLGLNSTHHYNLFLCLCLCAFFASFPTSSSFPNTSLPCLRSHTLIPLSLCCSSPGSSSLIYPFHQSPSTCELSQSISSLFPFAAFTSTTTPFVTLEQPLLSLFLCSFSPSFPSTFLLHSSPSVSL